MAAMFIPMPKPAPRESQGDVLPDPLQMEERRRAWALSQQGLHREAAEVWRGILSVRYDDADAAGELGLILSKLGESHAAVEAFERALSFNPASTEFKLNLSRALLKAERYADARYGFADVACVSPNELGAHTGLSAAFRGLKMPEAALVAAERACELNDKDPESLFAKAESLRGLKRNEEAAELLRSAVDRKADHLEAGLSLGDVLLDLHRSSEAVPVLKRTVETHPDSDQAWARYGIALLRNNQHARAVTALRRALDLKPFQAATYCNLGLALAGLSRWDEAVAACKSALAIEPASRSAHFLMASVHLIRGEFHEGWRAYEYRLSESDSRMQAEVKAAPWCGESLEGKSILVLGEQANGDYIQFVRYLKPLCEKAASVHVVVPKRLRRLLSSLVAPVTWLDSHPKDLRFDYQIFLMSVPLRFQELGLAIPTEPYLAAEEERISRWRERIGTNGFRIGINWHGNTYNQPDPPRPFQLANMLPIAQVPGVRLISLQIGEGAGQVDELPHGMRVETLGDDFDKGEDAFIDAAAVMANMDLVITCDTSLAHLAGALGKPVWIALNDSPEWRWQRDRSDSYWYPSARLFRQHKSGDWDRVFQDMAEQLRLGEGSVVAPFRAVAAPARQIQPKVAISWGELIDKITILEIKKDKAGGGAAASNIEHELSELNAALKSLGTGSAQLTALRTDLKRVNETLWIIEDDIRLCESKGAFDAEFVELARSVYFRNDERARIKRAINDLAGSAIVEEKLYASYARAKADTTSPIA
jgi:tetratricopeptide (TPR) repeat protein